MPHNPGSVRDDATSLNVSLTVRETIKAPAQPNACPLSPSFSVLSVCSVVPLPISVGLVRPSDVVVRGAFRVRSPEGPQQVEVGGIHAAVAVDVG